MFIFLVKILFLLNFVEGSSIKTDNIPFMCDLSMYQCNSGGIQCIDSKYKCDGENDCIDGSDELDCDTCLSNELKCSSGSCLNLLEICSSPLSCLNETSHSKKEVCNQVDPCLYVGARCTSHPFKCVPFHKLCDSVNDCTDASDEGRKCSEILTPGYRGKSLCGNLNCSHHCTILPSHQPICYTGGFAENLLKSHNILDPDICNLVELCEGKCTSHGGANFTCSCPTLSEVIDITSCISLHKDPPDIVWSTDWMQTEKPSYYDFANDRKAFVYEWLNLYNSYLQCVGSQHQEIEVLLNIPKIKIIEFDWLSNNTYMLSGKNIHVCHSKTDVNKLSSDCILILRTLQPTYNFTSLLLDPLSGYMFYTEQFNQTGQIMRSDMNGKNYVIIVQYLLKNPQLLGIDIRSRKLYFSDYLGGIQHVYYDGQQRQRIETSLIFSDSHIYSMFYMNGYLQGNVLNTKSKMVSTLNIDVLTFRNLTVISKPNKNMKMKVFKLGYNATQYGASFQCTTLNCEYICLLHPSTSGINSVAECVCPPWQILSSNRRSCEDRNELGLLYITHEPGAVKLTFPFQSQPQITSGTSLYINLNQPHGLFAFQREIGVLFFQQNGFFTISQKHLRLQSILGTGNIYICKGIAVDWYNGNLYWTDDVFNSINVASIFDATSRNWDIFKEKSVTGNVQSNLTAELMKTSSKTRVRAIVVHPKRGLIFWTAWINLIQSHGKTTYGAIKSSWMNGKNKTIIVSGPKIIWPNDLTLDRENDILYWTEGYYNRVESVHIDGTNRKLLLEENKLFTVQFQPFSIEFVKHKANPILFLSDYKSRQIYQLNITAYQMNGTTASYMKLIVKENQQIYDLHIWNKTLESGGGICATFSCSSNQICVPIPEPPYAECICTDRFEFHNGICVEIVQSVENSLHCPADYLPCNDGKCVLKQRVCDYENCDISRKSLNISCENQTTCGETGFLCKSISMCIPYTWVCDQDFDCPNGEDEINDHTNCTVTSCQPGIQFTCKNGKCINIEWVCDGIYNCEDKSDEAQCSENHEPELGVGVCFGEKELSCGPGTDGCILSRWKCDGELDCINGSDEKNCPNTTCPSGMRSCASSDHCVFEGWWCDGRAECTDKSDELDCPCNNSNSQYNQQLRCETNKLEYACVKKCDGKVDCLDGEDERNCHDIQQGSCLNSLCHYGCKDVDNGYICTCPEFHVLEDDGITCSETKTCSKRGICDQVCFSVLPGQHVCTCYDGWHIDNRDLNASKCLYDKTTPLPFILYTNKKSIKYMLYNASLNTVNNGNHKTSRKLTGSVNHPYGMDFHYIKRYLFYNDIETSTVSRVKVNLLARGKALKTSNKKVILDIGFTTSEGMAVDWIADRLYIVESTLDHIIAVDLNGKYLTVVLAGGIGNPRAIALDPRVGLLFWTDWESDMPRVERATMSGDNRTFVWRAGPTKVGWPNGLTIDYLEKRLYWADAKLHSIYSSDYNGNNKFTALWKSDWSSHPFSLTIYGQQLIWTDWRLSVIAGATKWSGDNEEVYQFARCCPNDVKVFHETRQPRAFVDSEIEIQNPCLNNRCGGLCLLTQVNGSLGSVCTCSILSYLGSDNRSCHPVYEFLLISTSDLIQGLSLTNPNKSVNHAISQPHLNKPMFVQCTDSYIYWLDGGVVKQASIAGSNVEEIVNLYATNVTSLAIDWARNYIFYMTLTYQQSIGKLRGKIGVIYITNTRLKYWLDEDIVGWENINQPYLLCIDSRLSIIYIASRDGIYSVYLDGSHLKKISNLQNVTDMTQFNNSLYCVQNGIAMQLKVNGNDDLWSTTNLNINATKVAVTHDAIWIYRQKNAHGGVLYKAIQHNDKLEIYFQREAPPIIDMVLFNASYTSMNEEDYLHLGSGSCVLDNGGCAHLCLPGKNSSERCVCAVGFMQKESDLHHCKAIEDFLLYSMENSIRTIDLNSNKEAMVPMNVSNPRGLSFFAERNLILWIDGAMNKIVGYQLSYSLSVELYVYATYSTSMESLSVPQVYFEGLAFDWIAVNIYWTDPGSDQIKVLKLGMNNPYIIYEGGEKLRGIAVAPVLGLLFACDWGEKSGGVLRMQLDGTSATQLIKSSGWPNGITIDYTNTILYWCDAKLDKIFSINIYGGPSKEVVTVNQKRTYGISFYDGMLYWTDSVYEGGSISSCNVSHNECLSGNIKTKVFGLGPTLLDAVAYSKKRQQGYNPCYYKNNVCQQFCFFIPPNKTKCGCSHGILNPDNRTCKAFDNYLVYSERTSLHSIDVDDPMSINEPIPVVQSADKMGSVIVMAMDYNGGRLFYSDMTIMNIYSINTNYTSDQYMNITTVVKADSWVEGMAYHQGENALYWTTSLTQSIMKYDLDQPNATIQTIVQSKLQGDRLRALGLYICESPNLIFWTNWNKDAPKIVRATTSGKNETAIIMKNLVIPNGLTIDYVMKYIYWADAKLDKLERCDFNGRNREVIAQGMEHVFSLTMLGDYLYWSDWKLHQIIRLNKWTGGDMMVLRNITYMNTMGVLAYYNDTCRENPCDLVTCQYRCIVTNNYEAKCMCSDGTLGDHCIGSTCDSDHFDCGFSVSGEICILYSLTCDGHYDCMTEKDENPAYCNTRVCRDGYLRCKNNKCINENLKCDSINDCGDNSDESNCQVNPTPSCMHGMFTCDNGACIPNSWKCDHENDCGDGSEENCDHDCPTDTFQCNTTGKCIPKPYKCDMEPDCDDGSDEANCETATCQVGYFQCVESKRCIFLRWTCDGHNDCTDGSDELSCVLETCKENEFRCVSSGKCVVQEWKCDFDEDCDDGSDEKDCNYTPCNSTFFQCSTEGQCIHRDWVCDGDSDCKDGSDERNCTTSQQDCNTTTHLQCDEGKCIELSRACDNVNDCNDYSDERNCNEDECKLPSLNHCNHICVDKKYSYTCACHVGYELNADGVSCDDIDECVKENPYPPCSQVCKNTKGGFQCSCASGYYKDNLHPTNCIAISGQPYIVFANKYYVREITLNASNTMMRLSHLRHVVALDFDWPGQMLYWSDVSRSQSVIQRMTLNYTYDDTDVEKLSMYKNTDVHLQGIETIHKSITKQVHGIAVDWVGRNLYWTDKGKNTIDVSTLDGRFHKILINTGLDEPRAIVLHPRLGYLFWTDWGQVPHIGRIGMDGTQRMIIIDNTILKNISRDVWPGKKIIWPNALTLDFAANKLFWADAKEDYIAYCNFDGSNPRIVYKRSSNRDTASNVFALSLFEDKLYWTDWDENSILSVDKFKGIRISKAPSILKTHLTHKPMDLKVVHPLRQPVPKHPHPCMIDNGGCEDLCLVSPQGQYMCACPVNFYLSDDQRTCISNCTYSEFVCKNDKCIPMWWKCDGVDDCGDNSDEPSNCDEFYCQPGQYQCKNSTKSAYDCISPSGICDGVVECKDGSDEINCDHHVCMSTQFKCSYSNPPQCILALHRCNGIPTCPMGEDELDCPASTCNDDQFSCQPSTSDSNRLARGILPGAAVCMPLAWKCDGVSDCVNGTDETNCTVTKCKIHQFQCASDRKCIYSSWMCDGDVDCIDGSDEDQDLCDNKTCSPTEFHCSNNECIPQEWVCDHSQDCNDNSDETACDFKCKEFEFSCTSDKMCISKLFLCDGGMDCKDSSDELNCNKVCEKGYKNCQGSSLCIPIAHFCDGFPDCFNATDEHNCTSVNTTHSCPYHMMQCVDGNCLPSLFKCDGEADCIDGSDEGPVCASFQCPIYRPFRCYNMDICLPISKLCDGVNDCQGDNSDELGLNCLAHKPPSTNKKYFHNSTHCLLEYRLHSRAGFLCSDGTCIDNSKLCDGVKECLYGEDETLCQIDKDCARCSPNHGHICITLPEEARGGRYRSYCSCKSGFKFEKDSHTCVDIDECELYDCCSQNCHNTPGSFHCSCMEGYASYGAFCRAHQQTNDSSPVLLVVAKEPPELNIFKIRGLQSLQNSTSFTNFEITRMTPHISDGAFFVDSKQNAIFYSCSKEKFPQFLVKQFSSRNEITGLEFDYLTNNLYWSDAVMGNVIAMKVNVTQLTSRRKRSLNENLEVVLISRSNSFLKWPLDIAISPGGYLFVADGGSNYMKPSILRKNLLTQNSPDVIISLSNNSWPTSIDLDRVASRIYWADKKTGAITSCTYDGRDKRVVWKFSSNKPYLIVLHEDTIYGTIFHSNAVFSVSKMGLVYRQQGAKTRKFLERDDITWLMSSSATMPVLAISQPANREKSRSVENECLWCGPTALCVIGANSVSKSMCICMNNMKTTQCQSYCQPNCIEQAQCVRNVCKCNNGSVGKTCQISIAPVVGHAAVPTSTVIATVGSVALLGICVIGVMVAMCVFKRKNYLIGFKHRRMGDSNTTVGELVYSELAATAEQSDATEHEMNTELQHMNKSESRSGLTYTEVQTDEEDIESASIVSEKPYSVVAYSRSNSESAKLLREGEDIQVHKPLTKPNGYDMPNK